MIHHKGFTRCKECRSIYNVLHEHSCTKRYPCQQCGIIHDEYSSMTTGISPCLTSLALTITELRARLDGICAECSGPVESDYLCQGCRNDL